MFVNAKQKLNFQCLLMQQKLKKKNIILIGKQKNLKKIAHFPKTRKSNIIFFA